MIVAVSTSLTYLFMWLHPLVDWRTPTLIAASKVQVWLGLGAHQLLSLPNTPSANRYLAWAEAAPDYVLFWAWVLLVLAALATVAAALWVFQPIEKQESHIFIRGTQKIKATK
jgi:hypothetical protein